MVPQRRVRYIAPRYVYLTYKVLCGTSRDRYILHKTRVASPVINKPFAIARYDGNVLLIIKQVYRLRPVTYIIEVGKTDL